MSLVQVIKNILSLVLPQWRDGFSLTSKYLPGQPFPFVRKGLLFIEISMSERETMEPKSAIVQ